MEYNFRDVLNILIKRWYVIIASVVVFCSAAFLITEISRPQYYSVQQKLSFLSKNAITDPSITDSYKDYMLDLNYTKVYMDRAMMIMHDKVIAMAVDDINTELAAQGISRQYYEWDLKNIISIETEQEVFNFVITVTAEHKEDIAVILREFNRTVCEKFKNIYDSNDISATDGGIVVNFQLYNTPGQVKLVPKGSMTSVILAAVIGISIAAVIIFIMQMLDNKIHSEKEITDKFGIPVLASVPQLLRSEDKIQGGK